MNEWTHLFSNDNLTTAERYRRIENSPIGWIARYFFKYSKQSPEPLAKYIKTIITGKTPPTGVQRYYETGEIDWFKPSDIGFSKFLIESKEKLSKVAVNEKKATLFDKNTLLINCIGDIGRVSILEKQASANQQITGITFNDNVVLEYAYYYFLANRDLFLSEQLVTTLPIINQTKIKNTPFICLAIGEQNNLIDYLNYCLDCFSENKSPSKKEYDLPEEIYKISNKLFNIYYFHLDILYENKRQFNIVSQLKQAILQEAIAGQLTTEWRTENPMQKGNPDTDAAALLAKIKAKKQQLIANGKLKKEKPLAEINFSNLTQLPNNWKWAKLGDLAESLKYGTSKKCSYSQDGLPVLRIPNLKDGTIDKSDLKYTELSNSEIQDYALRSEDVLMIRSNGSKSLVGRTAIISDDCEGYAYAGYLVRLRFVQNLLISGFLYLVFESKFLRDQIEIPVRTTTGVKNINSTEIFNLIIPLPPLAEQKAIVEKVDRLMNIIDQLEQQIKHRKQLAEDLMQTVLREAFE
jgi:type I restriction enzyme S subunit